MRGTLQERFEAKYLAEPNSGCFLWESTIIKAGYGRILHQQQHHLAHRISWLIYRGEIPIGMSVLHKCDQPSCVNPDHLFLGTSADNTHDMMQKGRKSDRHGENHHLAKLTVEDVISIRADTRRYREIAGDHGVTIATVCDIKHRRSWRHI